VILCYLCSHPIWKALAKRELYEGRRNKTGAKNFYLTSYGKSGIGLGIVSTLYLISTIPFSVL
jgi:hypothetical protein